jgi:elongation factor Ts
MANISAQQVKELRERTDCGMMECKHALVEAEGDLEKAAEILKIKGLTKASKKAGRVAADGLVATAVSPDGKCAAIIEVNCETDFVGREASFVELATQAAQLVFTSKTTDMAQLLQQKLANGSTLEDARLALVTKLGENITFRRADFIDAKDGVVAAYVHGGSNGAARAATLIALSKADKDLAYNLAMHVTAMKPEYIATENVDAARVAKEHEILLAQTAEQQVGKPKEMLEKIVQGKVNKFLQELTLEGQTYVKEQDKTVGALLKANNAKVTCMVRYAVGEGIEKVVTNFADEVRAASQV